MDVKGYFFGMDGKRKILIVNFLGHIQVAFRKMHGKAGRETVSQDQMVGRVPLHGQHLVLWVPA